jgi:hypothetical protein
MKDNYYIFLIWHWCWVNNIYINEEYNFENLYDFIMWLFNDSKNNYLSEFLDSELTKDILLNKFINIWK